MSDFSSSTRFGRAHQILKFPFHIVTIIYLCHNKPSFLKCNNCFPNVLPFASVEMTVRNTQGMIDLGRQDQGKRDLVLLNPATRNLACWINYWQPDFQNLLMLRSRLQIHTYSLHSRLQEHILDKLEFTFSHIPIPASIFQQSHPHVLRIKHYRKKNLR
jgi:hypothetical protein